MRPAVWTVAAALAASACNPSPLPGEPSGVHVLLIGLDGADWDRIEPLMREKRLPHIGALVERGATARIAFERPPLSPLLWTTLATARRPDAHGILDFAEPEGSGGRLVPITGRGRRVKALWNFADDAGLSSVTVGWWATWPAEEVRGAMVADRWAYSLVPLAPTVPVIAGTVSPTGLLPALGPLRVDPGTLTERDLRRFFPYDIPGSELTSQPAGPDGLDDPVAHLRRVVASTKSFEAAALRLMRDLSPDLTLVYFEGIDEVGHRFARYEPPDLPGVTVFDRGRYGGVLDAFYRYQDEVVGHLVEAAGPDAAVVIVSDHGFARGAERPPEEPADLSGRAALWHVGPGILVLAGEPFTRARLGQAHLTDVAPTLLAVLGLPLAEDFEGGPLTAAIRGGFLAAHPVRTILSWERVGSRVRRVAAPSEAAGGGAADAEARIARLKGLGYIADTPALRTGSGMTAAARLNLATVLAEKGRVDEAVAAYRGFIAVEPEAVLGRRGLFDLLVQAGRTEEALTAGHDLLASARSPSANSYAAVARLWVETGRIEEGKSFLQQHRGEPAAAGPQLAQGLLAEAEGRTKDAEVHYRAALYREPGSWDAAEAVFRLFEKQDRLPEAVPLLRQGLVARGGNSIPHLIALGYVSLQKGDNVAAEDYLTRAAEEAGDEPEVQLYLGSVYYRTGRYADAARAFGAVLASDPSHLEARANQILALGRSGKVAQALDSFRAAGETGRNTPLLLNAAAWACLLNGLAEDGQPLVERSLSLDPDQPEIRKLAEEMKRRAAPGGGKRERQ